MRAWTAALRALPVTFLIYVVEAVLGLMLSVPLAGELGSDARALGASAIAHAARLEHALSLAPALRVHGRASLLIVFALLLLTPLLHMAWLSALAAPLAPRQALAEGVRLYLRACLTSLAVGVVLALCLAPWALAAHLCDTWIDPARHARMHDVALALCAASALPVLWLGHVGHDLARAFGLRHSALVAARLGLRAALSLRTELVALALWLAALLAGVGPLLCAATRGPGELGGIALLQAGCFGALAVRSLWLAHALACTERYGTSRDPSE